MSGVFLLAAVITAHPLANADVLEPSVQNEVDHALDVASTNEVQVTEALVGFAALYATNGLNATDCAIRLISTQRDGRWLWNGADVTPVAVRILRRLSGTRGPMPRLAISAGQVAAFARRGKTTFEEAARKVGELGFEISGTHSGKGQGDACESFRHNRRRCGELD